MTSIGEQRREPRVAKGMTQDALAEVKAFPQSTTHEANGQILRTSEEGNYFITLLVDRNDICLGVMEERE